jgi:RHS repeat-associated protein
VQAAAGSGTDFAPWSDGSSVRAVKSFNPVVASEVRVRFTSATDASGLVWLTELQAWNTPGQTTATERFDAWGKLEQAAGSVPTYGYTGREPDATGLIHYRARYYSPEIGRFVSRDPLGLSAGINPYAYADGNPVLFNDPDGLMAALAWISANQYYNDYQVGTRVQGALQFGAGLRMGAGFQTLVSGN